MLFEQFFDKAGGVDFAVGKAFAVQVHGGHALDVVRFDLFLEEAAVNHFTADLRVEQGELVEGLHDVRAVVAGKGDVGGEVQRLLDAADERLDAVVKFERAAARLQDGKDERGKFMATGDASKDDAGIRTIGAQGEADGGGECGISRFFKMQARRGRGDLREEGFEFVAFFVCAGREDKSDVAAEDVHVLADSVQHGLVKLHGVPFVCGLGKTAWLSRLAAPQIWKQRPQALS